MYSASQFGQQNFVASEECENPRNRDQQQPIISGHEHQLVRFGLREQAVPRDRCSGRAGARRAFRGPLDLASDEQTVVVTPPTRGVSFQPRLALRPPSIGPVSSAASILSRSFYPALCRPRQDQYRAVQPYSVGRCPTPPGPLIALVGRARWRETRCKAASPRRPTLKLAAKLACINEERIAGGVFRQPCLEPLSASPQLHWKATFSAPEACNARFRVAPCLR